MIQSSQVMNGIGKQRLAHSNPIRRSLRNICYDASLSEQFADISTGIVIPVYNQSTGLTDVGFVNLARFVQSSASAAELRSMIRIDFIEGNNIFFAKAGNRMKEFSIRDFIDNLIGFSSFGISEFPSSPEIFQILNDNRGITETFAQRNYLVSNLPAIIFNEIIFIMLQSSQTFESFLTSQISKTFEFGFSSFNNLPLDKHFFSKIEMPEKSFIFGIVNRNSNIISVGVYSNNILALNGFFKFFFNENLNSEILENENRIDLPTTNQIFNKSLISTILNNRQMNSFAFSVSCNRDDKQFFICFYGKHSFVKSYWNTLDFITDFSSQKNLKKRSLNKSTLKMISLSEIFVNHRLKLVSANSFIVLPNRKNLLRTSKIFIIQSGNLSLLPDCRFSDIDSDCFLHHNREDKNNAFIYFYIPQFIPNLNKHLRIGTS